jgi:hypothetical protein
MQTTPGRCVPAHNRGARRVISRPALAAAAVGIGFFTAISALGADLWTGYPKPMAVTSEPAPAGPRTTRPVDLPDVQSDRSAQRARLVDRLYEQLMRRTATGCPSGSAYASLGGGC